ncbi:MAG: DUF424 family protein [Candidatus Woesearchaeota archaeon]|jgi:hypothetical protein|nr:DUF424 family protein [Candidatus Woesearchaeota archaeon]MDP7324417.1 DUF424 family protein [Candidatus Woesearchaeota archaeon]MDP7457251.1 DUF424 family protein [Candidatus Woesearchaeota archaeon]|tara:strand:+ start:519 stop:815 length:297 start_codon:yes stop_codon:yes gene_type:complete
MLVKIHKKPQGKTVVAICDKSLIGKTLEEGNMELNLDSDFYKGENAAGDMIADMMRNADVVNLVGQKSIALALKEGILEKEEIKKVQGIPHAQIILMD